LSDYGRLAGSGGGARQTPGTKVPLNRGYYQNGPGVSSTSQ
jgi:hypothetical protein